MPPTAVIASERASMLLSLILTIVSLVLLTLVSQQRESITDVKTIAERLKDARERAGLTQPELAARAGVSSGTIGNIESGARKSPRELLAIAAAVGVRPEWLQHGRGPMEASGDHVAEPEGLYQARSWPFSDIDEEKIRSLKIEDLRRLEVAFITAAGLQSVIQPRPGGVFLCPMAGKTLAISRSHINFSQSC